MVALLHWFMFLWGPDMGPLSFTSTEVEYAVHSGQRMTADIVRPVGDKIYPGVLLVHGGSWSGRSREDMTKIAEFIASHGHVVMNLSYRFAPKHRYPAQVEDIAAAVTWFKAHAQRWRMDPTKMAGWGYSAGGHLIAQWALLESEKMGAPALQALVVGGAPLDLSWYPQSPIITHLLDGFRDQRLKEYKEASPVNHVTKHMPPILLYHGKTDTLVEAVQSSHMQNLVRDAGVEARLHIIDFWGHVGTFLWGASGYGEGLSFLKEKLQ